jgi:hypothetical protein
MKFDGTSWVNVGNAGFSDFIVNYTSLAFNSSGEPCVAFEDYGNSAKATVMKFDGTSWVNLGIAGFSADTVLYTSLAFNPSGEPYVAYMDGGNNNKATVMEYTAPVGIRKLQLSMLTIYPNPTSTEITIETSATIGQCHLSIMNLNGKEFISYKITQPKTQIDVSTLPNGVYFVRLTNERTVEIGKFIKN